MRSYIYRWFVMIRYRAAITRSWIVSFVLWQIISIVHGHNLISDWLLFRLDGLSSSKSCRLLEHITVRVEPHGHYRPAGLVVP